MKKVTSLSMLILMVLFLVGCGKQTTIQIQSTAPTTTQSVTQQTLANEIANWELYTDTERRIEFKYFKNDDSFVVSEGRSFSVEKEGVEVLYGNFQHKTILDSSDCPKNFKNIGSITIDGIIANKCVDIKDIAGPAWNVVIQKKSSDGVDSYIISCSNEYGDFESYCEQLLSTFKFIK